VNWLLTLKTHLIVTQAIHSTQLGYWLLSCILQSKEYALLTEQQAHSDSLNIEDVDIEINKVLDFMEPVSSDQQKETIDQCTFWAGTWIALADGNFIEAEHENLKKQIGEAIYNNSLAELESSDDKIKLAEEKFYKTATPLKTLSAPDRCALIQRLIVIARADQHIDETEYAVLYKICDELNVEQSFVQQILVFLN